MTNREIWQIAMRQSAIDANCDTEDFKKKENVVVCSGANPQTAIQKTLKRKRT